MMFSAADLVKKSASQLLFLELHKVVKPATSQQIEGNNYAERIVTQDGASSEKRGILTIDDDVLFFCIDYVKDNLCVEIKMIKNSFEQWYLNQSILQATLYATLLTKVKTLDTPKFRVLEGYAQERIDVPQGFEYQLWFGPSYKYRVTTNEAIFAHYREKMKLVSSSVATKDYVACKGFDAKYKFKEFDMFKPEYVMVQHQKNKSFYM